MEDKDFYKVAEKFDNVDHYIYQFGLTDAQQANIKDQRDTQTAI